MYSPVIRYVAHLREARKKSLKARGQAADVCAWAGRGPERLPPSLSLSSLYLSVSSPTLFARCRAKALLSYVNVG